MKYILILLTLLISTTLFAQESEKVDNKIIVTVSEGTSVQVIHPNGTEVIIRHPKSSIADKPWYVKLFWCVFNIILMNIIFWSFLYFTLPNSK